MFRGSMPALITPFDKNGAIDEKCFSDFVEWQIASGSHALVPTGTTGESPTLTHDEHIRVVELCVKQTKGRIPVIAGAGSNSTREAIDLATRAEAVGADALLVVAPYYNKPSPNGQVIHFSQIAKAVKIPIFIYNIPGRSVIDILPDTIKKIRKQASNIIGIKDATNNLPRAMEQRLTLGEDFILLSGEDASLPAFLAMGGVGCISVVANVAPKLYADMIDSFAKADMKNFCKLRDSLFWLSLALFCENSPAPTKYALSLLKKSSPWVRAPLAECSDTAKQTIENAMRHAGITW
ncbi:MAG: 4-hydroxy-tetrahydrodipicolinate synthase [Alphaproteobacteria bacterium]